MNVTLDSLIDGLGGGLLEALLAASWKGGLVVLLVLAVQAVLGRRLPARWRYALWLLVAVRLLLPAGPPSPLSLFWLAGPGSGSPLPGLGAIPAPAGGAAAVPSPPDAPALGLAAAALALWVLGLAAVAVRYGALRRRLWPLLAGAAPVNDPDEEVDRDLVWVDGYFITWPERE